MYNNEEKKENKKVIDIRKVKTPICILDVETANGLDNPLIYELGITLAIPTHEPNNKIKLAVIYHESLLFNEIYNNYELMSTSMYGYTKKSIYNDLLAKNKAHIYTKKEFNKHLKDILNRNGVKYITAYNAKFDFNALQVLSNTFGLINIIGLKKFIKFDIMYQAIDVFTQDFKYFIYCIKNNLITPKGFASSTVDSLSKYINRRYKGEKHVGYYDTIDEKKILEYCININPYIKVEVYPDYNHIQRLKIPSKLIKQYKKD